MQRKNEAATDKDQQSSKIQGPSRERNLSMRRKNRFFPLHLVVGEDHNQVTYEVALRGPAHRYSERIDVLGQAADDDLALRDISRQIERWAKGLPQVSQINFSYSSGRYVVAVVSDETSDDERVGLHIDLDYVRDLFGKHRPVVYVLGTMKQNAPFFDPYKSHICYLRNENISEVA